MPSAIKTAAEYGDDLQVIFVERQGATAAAAERFAYKRKWMGTSAMWTTETPFRIEGRTIPRFALLSASGEVLMTGNPLSMHSKIMKAIDAEIAGAKKAPKDAPKALRSAYKAFAKGEFAKALGATDKVMAAGGVDSAAAAAAAETFKKAIDAEFDRVDWLLKNGYLLKAADLSKSMGKALKGASQYEEEVAARSERFSSEKMKSEFKAAKSLDRLHAALNENGLDPKIAKKLETFVSKNGDALVAARASQLLSLFE